MSKDYKIGIVVGLIVLVVGVVYYSVTTGKDQPAASESAPAEIDNQPVLNSDAPSAETPVMPVEVPAPVQAAGQEKKPAPAEADKVGLKEGLKEWEKKWHMPSDKNDASPAAGKVADKSPGDSVETGFGETGYASAQEGSGDTDGGYFKLDDDANKALREKDPESVSTYQPERVADRGKEVYVVKENDSLYKIAEKVYGSRRGYKWRLIRDANPGIDPDALPVGKRLRIPPLTFAPPTAVAKRTAPTRTAQPGLTHTTAVGKRVYVVSKADNAGFWGIAKKIYGPGNGHRYLLIQKANPGINPRRLRSGTKLIIPPLPAKTASPRTAPGIYRSDISATGSGYYTVKRNDTIWGIAKGNAKYMNLIIQANPNVDPDNLKLGQRLKLPPKPRTSGTPGRRPTRPIRQPVRPGEPDFGR